MTSSVIGSTDIWGAFASMFCFLETWSVASLILLGPVPPTVRHREERSDVAALDRRVASLLAMTRSPTRYQGGEKAGAL